VVGRLELNGDARAEYAVGAWLADGPPTAAGRVTLYSHADPLGSSYCFGDGSGTDCPCGNIGGPQEGCANSTGDGSLLLASGTPSLAADDLAFTARQMVPNQPALLFAGQNAVNGGAGAPFGDGLRCAGGDVRRLGVRMADPTGVALYGPGLLGDQGFLPGQQRRFQAWYRDPSISPCGSGFNLTPGYAVVFTL
jgi:hypothetical protein